MCHLESSRLIYRFFVQPFLFQFLSMRIASMSRVLYGFGMGSDRLHDQAQV
jgi:hypothetical protein